MGVLYAQMGCGSWNAADPFDIRDFLWWKRFP
jgi:hypothetical protein